jgi:hypothetical protein
MKEAGIKVEQMYEHTTKSLETSQNNQVKNDTKYTHIHEKLTIYTQY